MKNLFALLLVTGIALSALCQEAVQRFKLVGDYSSKWEIYEITEDSCGEFEFTHDFDGRTVKNKEFCFEVVEERVFAVHEYKSEKRKNDDNRIIFLVLTESKKGIKKVNLNKLTKRGDGDLMIVDYKQEKFSSQKRKERN